VLERAGVMAGPDQLAAPGVFVAGDVAAGEPRTVLAAVRAGARAGARAAAIGNDERRKAALFA
jgi:thioredoxin reductase